MAPQFIATKEGDFIDPRFTTTVSPNPCDPAVSDRDQITGILANGFMYHARCGDLRAALGIEVVTTTTKAKKTAGVAS